MYWKTYFQKQIPKNEYIKISKEDRNIFSSNIMRSKFIFEAFALRGDQVIDSTHLMMSVIMLIFVNDKLSDKIKKD